MVYINATGDEELFRQLSSFTPPILLLFFVRSGLTFRLDVLAVSSTGEGEIPLLLVGLVYCVVRVLGKYGGSFLGCVLTRKDKRVRNFLGLTLIPQASVAIGLAALGERALGGEAGEKLVTVVLTASLLYELIGPACARMALYRSGACGEDEAEPMKELEEST
jgi:Kef-type K+ transport system membrane component KefB